MAGHKPDNIDILIPLWGAAQVEMFLSYGLPTLLADGNLPSLVDRANATFVFLTGEADRAGIEAHAVYGRLRALCKVEFASVDDLIAPGSYGMTITLSLARGLLRRGHSMTEYAFIILMGDFVFAKNGLKAVYDALENASAVFAPTYRAGAEQVSAYVTRQIQAHEGALEPRSLADVIIDNLHMTVRAQFVDNAICHAEHVNQLYWSKNADTVLSHQFLMHLFAIRPERPLTRLDYFFDYGLFDDICPSGRYAVIDDSDRLLVLEMQSIKSQLGQIQWGPADVQALRGSLSGWTCRIHRELAAHALVLHRADLRQPITELGAESRGFVADLLGCLSEQIPAANHPYWRGALAVWHRHRDGRHAGRSLSEFGMDDSPAEIEQPQAVLGLAAGLSRAFVGQQPLVTILHPQWAEFRALRKEVDQFSRLEGPLAVATFQADTFGRLGIPKSTCKVMSLAHLATLPAASQSGIMVDLPWVATDELTVHMDNARRALRPGGSLLLSMRDAFGEQVAASGHSVTIFQALQRHRWDQIEVRAIGGPWRRISVALLAASLRSMVSEKTGTQIKGLICLGVISCQFVVANIAHLFRRRPPLVGHETMVLCWLRRPAGKSASEPQRTAQSS